MNDESLGIRLVVTHELKNAGCQTQFSNAEAELWMELQPVVDKKLGSSKKDERHHMKFQTVHRAFTAWQPPPPQPA